jgi:hypothetical protein
VWPHFDKSKGSYLNEHICQWVLSTTYYYYPLCVCMLEKNEKDHQLCGPTALLYSSHPPTSLPGGIRRIWVFVFQLLYFSFSSSGG